MKASLLRAMLVAGALVAAAASATDRPEPGTPVREAVDRLQLDATTVTGNRELPKVMSIVPWKPAEPPSGPERPMGSLIEELLAPLDRDEFRREITYYRGLTPQSSAVEARTTGRPVADAVPESHRSGPSGPTGASVQ
jgi:hypothetical protein